MPLSREPKAREIHTDEVDQKGGFVAKVRDGIARAAADLALSWVAKINKRGVYYGECGTAAATAAKEATLIDGDGFTLTKGVVVAIKFTNGNDAANPTLNVNGTGAKGMMTRGTQAMGTNGVSTGYYSNAINFFIYDGTNWVRNWWWNTNSLPALGMGSASCSTAAATAAKTASLSNFVLVSGALVTVKFTYAVNAGAALNINSTGAKPIWWHGSAISDGIIKAGDRVLLVYVDGYYHVLAVDRMARDSGWRYLDYTSPFTVYNSQTENRPRYRKNGAVVEIRGAATVSEAITPGDTAQKMFTLPETFRPGIVRYYVCSGSGANKWLLRIDANGNVNCYRYGSTTTTGIISVGSWLPFNATFIAD